MQHYSLLHEAKQYLFVLDFTNVLKIAESSSLPMGGERGRAVSYTTCLRCDTDDAQEYIYTTFSFVLEDDVKRSSPLDFTSYT